MKRRFPKEWKPALSHLFIQLANQQMSFEYLPNARDFSRHWEHEDEQDWCGFFPPLVVYAVGQAGAQ